MKKSIRFVSTLLVIVMALSLFASCGNNTSNSSGKAKSTSESGNVKTESSNSAGETENESGEIKIEDIDWSVDEGVIDGERYVMLSYTNNSEFTIAGIGLSFVEKSDITEEQKTKYFEEIKIVMDIDETDEDDVSDFEELKKREISMSVESDRLCRSGESVSYEFCHYYSGYRYLRNIEHFALVEPDIAVIKYVYDNKIYTVNYDFKSEKYTKENKSEVAYYWTENEIGNSIPKPNAEIVSCGYDNDDSFSFDIYGWTIDDFNAYVKECKEKGFTIDTSEYEGFYSADSENGLSVYLSFDDDDGEVYVRVSTASSDSDEYEW